MSFNFHHLSQVEETYFEHFRFAMWAGLVMLLLGVVSIIHAIFPFFFSRLPDKIYKYFQTKSKERIERVNETLRRKKIE